jgi:hypothetical protein
VQNAVWRARQVGAPVTKYERMSRYLVRYRVPFQVGAAEENMRSIDGIVEAACQSGAVDVWVGPRIAGGVTRVYATALTLENVSKLKIVTGQFDPDFQELS